MLTPSQKAGRFGLPVKQHRDEEPDGLLAEDRLCITPLTSRILGSDLRPPASEEFRSKPRECLRLWFVAAGSETVHRKSGPS